MLWKIYFWITTILVSISWIDVFMVGVVGEDVVDLVVIVITQVGFFGFVYKKTFLTLLFWKIWFFILVVWDSVYSYLSLDTSMFGDMSITATIIIVISAISIVIPYYMAMFLYAYKSSKIWKIKDDNE